MPLRSTVEQPDHCAMLIPSYSTVSAPGQDQNPNKIAVLKSQMSRVVMAH